MTTQKESDIQAEQELGTVIKLLWARKQEKAVTALLGANRVFPSHENSDYGTSYYDIYIEVDADRFDEYQQEDLFLHIQSAYDLVWAGTGREVSGVVLKPALVATDWRDNVDNLLRGSVSNQATLAPLPPGGKRQDNLNFRDKAELSIYQALKNKQRTLCSSANLAIVPNCAVRVDGHTWEPDFLVIYDSRAGVIEVDGASHRKKYASDKSRDALLLDAGFKHVDRIDVVDAENPQEAARFVDKFLLRLTR